MSTKQNYMHNRPSRLGKQGVRLAAILAFAVCGSTASAQWPDLVVSSITPSVTNPTPGQNFTVRVTVTNIGDTCYWPFYVDFNSELPLEPMDECFDYEGYLTYDLDLDHDGYVDPIWHGWQVSWDVPVYYTSAGSHNFWAWVDACPSYVIESNEFNNKLGRTIQVATPSQPDLVVDSISLPLGMTSPRIGEQFSMTVWVRNNGPVATGSFYVLIDTDRATVPTTSCVSEQRTLVAGLGARGAANDNIQLSFPVTYSTAGSHTFWARADGCASIGESNETNNNRSRISTIRPDLTVTILGEGPDRSFPPGTLHHVAVAIKNVGTARSIPCQVHSFIDLPGQPVTPCSGTIHTIGAVEPGSFALVLVPVQFNAPADHSLWIWADACNQISELSEANNKKNATLYVRVP